MNRFYNFLKILLGILIISITINLLVIAIQIIVQSANQEFYISIGFPFHFFYFNEPHGFHGSNIPHFLYDGLITLVLAIIGILIYKRISIKKSVINRSRDVLDSE